MTLQFKTQTKNKSLQNLGEEQELYVVFDQMVARIILIYLNFYTDLC